MDLVSKEISDINKRTNGQQDLKATLQSRLSTLKKLTKEEVLETLMFLQQKFFARHIATHVGVKCSLHRYCWRMRRPWMLKAAR